MSERPQIREIVEQASQVSTQKANVGDDLRGWLADCMKEQGLKYLLAHADDGVIWGQLVKGKDELVIARDRAEQYKHLLNVCPPLRIETLWEARAFGETKMVHLWRDGTSWRETFYRDEQPSNGESPTFRHIVKECQLTWGERDARYTFDDFTVMRDGQQGLVHVPPVAPQDNQQLWLVVRHYVSEDEETGFNRIAATRLVDLKWDKEK